MTRNRRTRQEWFSLIEQCKSSGSTVKEFCQQEGIQLSNFYYWSKRYRSLELDGELVPLTITDNATSRAVNSSYEIVYPNGVILRLAQPVPLNVLSPLLRLF